MYNQQKYIYIDRYHQCITSIHHQYITTICIVYCDHQLVQGFAAETTWQATAPTPVTGRKDGKEMGGFCRILGWSPFCLYFLGDLFDFKWDWIGYITNDMWFCVWKLGILIWIGYLKVENIMINPYESMDLGVAYFQTILYLCWLILGMKPRISIDKQRIDLWTTMILYLLKPQLLGGFL